MVPEPSVSSKSKAMLLPLTVIGPGDLGRLKRELDLIDDFLRQAAIRKTGEPMKLPPTTAVLDDLATTNECNLLQEADRKQLAGFLLATQKAAPVMHISFAADPSESFMVKIMKWFRENIHPQTLVQVGLQPNIAAGCILRTPNKQFDFSLRKNFGEKRDLLVEKIHEVNAGGLALQEIAPAAGMAAKAVKKAAPAGALPVVAGAPVKPVASATSSTSATKEAPAP
jgi:hypothetical protein